MKFTKRKLRRDGKTGWNGTVWRGVAWRGRIRAKTGMGFAVLNTFSFVGEQRNEAGKVGSFLFSTQRTKEGKK